MQSRAFAELLTVSQAPNSDIDDLGTSWDDASGGWLRANRGRTHRRSAKRQNRNICLATLAVPGNYLSVKLDDLSISARIYVTEGEDDTHTMIWSRRNGD